MVDFCTAGMENKAKEFSLKQIYGKDGKVQPQFVELEIILLF